MAGTSLKLVHILRWVLCAYFTFHIVPTSAQSDLEKLHIFYDTSIVYDHANYHYGDVLGINHHTTSPSEMTRHWRAAGQDFNYDSLRWANSLGFFWQAGQKDTHEFIGCKEFKLTISGTSHAFTLPYTVIHLDRIYVTANGLNVQLTGGSRGLAVGDSRWTLLVCRKDGTQRFFRTSHLQFHLGPEALDNVSMIKILPLKMKNIPWARAGTEVITFPEVTIILH